MTWKCVDELSATELRGKRVFLRTSLNLPIKKNGQVDDIFRLRRALPTLEFLVERGARVIIAGYFGRSGDSMKPVAEAFIGLAPHIPIHFLGAPLEHAHMEVGALKDGQCLILENLRRNPGEEANDPAFCETLASLVDIFVGDAFAEAHRAYASNVGLAKLLPAYAGLLMCEEVTHLERARRPHAPSFAILGGAKFETKAPLIRSLLEAYDAVFITGALANDVFKARGLPVGRSLVSKELPDSDVLAHPHFIAPVDVVAERSDGHAHSKKPEAVQAEDKIVDIGPDSVALVAPYIGNANFILWNGPTGLYEAGYVSWTHAIAELVAKRAEAGASVVIGGGDTIAAIRESGLNMEHLGFLSTGGGAMLEFLLQGNLPGLEALGYTHS